MANNWPPVTTRYVSESRWSKDAPKIPCDRPPTRRECWEYVEHYYKGVKTREDAILLAIRIFTGNYIHWVQTRGWDRQPDWTENDPIIPSACPIGRDTFSHNNGGPGKWRDHISTLLIAWGKKPLPARTRAEQKEEDQL